MPVVNRRTFLKAASTIGVAGAVAFVPLNAFGETTHPRLTRLDVPIAHLPEAFDGFRIVQLSDFHYDVEFNIVPVHRGIEIANQLKADLVVLTGDFITLPVWVDYLKSARRTSARAAEPCAERLNAISSRMGSYAVLGNHDADSDVALVEESLKSHGIRLLKNQATPLEHNGARIWLAGIDDAINGKPDLAATMKPVPAGEVTIMLAHEPDVADDIAKLPVALQLSGHSHWGQAWLPVIGSPFLPDLAKKYPVGLYHIGPLTLYTNAGLGTIRAPIRINAPPEVTEVTLRVRRS